MRRQWLAHYEFECVPALARAPKHVVHHDARIGRKPSVQQVERDPLSCCAVLQNGMYG